MGASLGENQNERRENEDFSSDFQTECFYRAKKKIIFFFLRMEFIHEEERRGHRDLR